MLEMLLAIQCTCEHDEGRSHDVQCALQLWLYAGDEYCSFLYALDAICSYCPCVTHLTPHI